MHSNTDRSSNEQGRWVKVDEQQNMANEPQADEAREITERISRNIREEQANERYRSGETNGGNQRA